MKSSTIFLLPINILNIILVLKKQKNLKYHVYNRNVMIYIENVKNI